MKKKAFVFFGFLRLRLFLSFFFLPFNPDCLSPSSPPPLAHARLTKNTQNTPKNNGNNHHHHNNPQQQRFASYDFLSAGMGALAVTSYCVWRGQDPLTALSITAASTITALVANELLVEAERKQQE